MTNLHFRVSHFTPASWLLGIASFALEEGGSGRLLRSTLGTRGRLACLMSSSCRLTGFIEPRVVVLAKLTCPGYGNAVTLYDLG